LIKSESKPARKPKGDGHLTVSGQRPLSDAFQLLAAGCLQAAAGHAQTVASDRCFALEAVTRPGRFQTGREFKEVYLLRDSMSGFGALQS